MLIVSLNLLRYFWLTFFAKQCSFSAVAADDIWRNKRSGEALVLREGGAAAAAAGLLIKRCQTSEKMRGNVFNFPQVT